jgi:ankyrin repeat protein
MFNENTTTDYTSFDKNGDTALTLACKNSKNDEALQILDNECNLDKFNTDGENALILACKNSLTDVALKILDKHDELNKNIVFDEKKIKTSMPYKFDSNGYTSLLYAGMNKMNTVIERLIELGEKCNPYNVNWVSNKNIILVLSSYKKIDVLFDLEDLIFKIIKKFPDFDYRLCDVTWQNILYNSIQNNLTKLSNHLLDNYNKDSDINTNKDILIDQSSVTDGLNIINIALQQPNYEDICNKLLDLDCDVYNCNVYLSDTVLLSACNSDYTKVAIRIIEKLKSIIKNIDKSSKKYQQYVDYYNFITGEHKNPLKLACDKKNEDVVLTLLFQKDANNNFIKDENNNYILEEFIDEQLFNYQFFMRNDDYDNALVSAIKNKLSEDIIIQLFMNTKDILKYKSPTDNFLTLAIKSNLTNLINYIFTIIDKSDNNVINKYINFIDNDNNNILMLACINNITDDTIINKLFGYNIDIFHTNSLDETLLIIACKNKSLKIINKLFTLIDTSDDKIKIDYIDYVSYYTHYNALMWAYINKLSYNIITKLSKYTKSVNYNLVINYDISSYINELTIDNIDTNNDILLLLCENKSYELAKQIINRNNYSLTNINKYGNNALMIACENMQEDIAVMLLNNINDDNKCDIINEVNMYGNNVLMIALNNKLTNVINILNTMLDKINLAQINKLNDTALIIACNNKLDDIAKSIIVTSKSFDMINSVNLKNENALILAVKNDLKNTVQELEQYIDNINSVECDTNGCNILMYLVNSSLDFENELYSFFDKIFTIYVNEFKNNNNLFNKLYNNGRNAFARACKENKPKIANCLFDYSDIYIIDTYGFNVFPACNVFTDSIMINKLIDKCISDNRVDYITKKNIYGTTMINNLSDQLKNDKNFIDTFLDKLNDEQLYELLSVKDMNLLSTVTTLYQYGLINVLNYMLEKCSNDNQIKYKELINYNDSDPTGNSDLFNILGMSQRDPDKTNIETLCIKLLNIFNKDGLDKLKKTNKHLTALEGAVIEKLPNLINELLNYDNVLATLSTKDICDGTVLIILADYHYENVINKILEICKNNPNYECEPNKFDIFNRTTLIVALNNKLLDAATNIIKTKNCNPGIVMYTNDTALLIACRNNYKDIIDLLFETYNVDITTMNIGWIDNNSESALSYLIKNNYSDLALKLLEHPQEFDLNHVNNDNHTVLQLATQNNMQSVIDRLNKLLN